MFHEPAQKSGKDPASAYKTRVGNWMFLLYALIYAGFVAINITSPTLMEAEVLWGLNLAVVYGFFLIIFALVLAVIYNHLCGKKEAEMAANDGEEGQ
jgi:uncharacterized membrane protein (DUF485 family)